MVQPVRLNGTPVYLKSRVTRYTAVLMPYKPQPASPPNLSGAREASKRRLDRPGQSRERFQNQAAETAGRDQAWRGENARWYDAVVGEGGSQYQEQLIFPGALRLLSLKRGEQLLDVACGQGAFVRLTAQAGAAVTGVDLSPELIRLAKERSKAVAARFMVGDARSLGERLKGVTFDAAVCLLAIQNMEPIEPVCAGLSVLLKPRGRLVLVLNHPAFRIPRQSEWGWDEARKIAYRRVDRYLSPLEIPIQTHPGSRPGMTTWSFHRPLQSYVMALTEAGFVINALEEWASQRTSQPGPRARAENRARAEFPLFLALRAVKLG